MTQQDFILKWAATIEHVTQNKALVLAFMLDVKELVDDATKKQRNVANELIKTLETFAKLKPYTDDTIFNELQESIDSYKSKMI